jgi:hypothetical protein
MTKHVARLSPPARRPRAAGGNRAAQQKRKRGNVASIDMQAKAIATGKRLKRPKVKVRNGALSDTGIIVEVTAPDGTRCLIDIDTHRGHKGLTIRPRAKFDGQEAGDVSVEINSHDETCLLNRHYEYGDSRIDAARCDCGSELVPVEYDWRHTWPVRP